MFNTNPQLNQQSTGAIPINSMYDTEKEREAMVPPPMTEAHEEAIKETLSEQIQESGYKDSNYGIYFIDIETYVI